MKLKKLPESRLTLPLLTDLIERSKVQEQTTLSKISGVDSAPLAQPNLYQDSGSGYNRNFVFPQD